MTLAELCVSIAIVTVLAVLWLAVALLPRRNR
jgi:Tfp pilus assembly protein PilE